MPDHPASGDFPQFETSAAQVAQATDETLKGADKQLANIASLEEPQLTFRNVFVALDDIENAVGLLRYRVDFTSVSHPDDELRKAAEESFAKVRDWSIAAYNREDVYRAVRHYQESNISQVRTDRESLSPVDKRLMTYFDRKFRRNGLSLEQDAREKVAGRRKELGKLEDEHKKNYNESDWVTFTKDELTGIPADVRTRFKLADGMYHVRADASETSSVYKNSPSEAARKKALSARYSRAFGENVDVTPKIFRLRAQIAQLLGYSTWAEYQAEISMMKKAASITKFLGGLNTLLDPIFRDDLADLNRLKRKDLNYPETVLQSWDIDYYASQLLKQKYDLDLAILREFFEYREVLKSMFTVVQQVFGLKIEEIEVPQKWHEEITAIRISDAETGRSFGIVYLDMFPREGKADSFSEWTIVPRKRLANGNWQSTVAVLLCNFPKQMGTEPVLLDLRDVETLFHEFGHALHDILSGSPYSVLAGTNGVEPDFVEAPSTMMEGLVTDLGILKIIAKHYQDSTKELSPEIIKKTRESRAFSDRLYYKRQLSCAQMDMNLHITSDVLQDRFNPTSYTDRIMTEIFLASPEATSFINTLTHVTSGGYDARYYVYVWAKALASDLASVFEQSEKGFMDSALGTKYRREILEVGGTRDSSESVKAFLGRDFDEKAFLRKLDIE